MVALGPRQTWMPESWPGYKDLNADEILRALFPVRNLKKRELVHPFPSLEEFHLRTVNNACFDPPVDMTYMFGTMPSSLRSIVLQAPNLRLTPLFVRDLKAAVLPALDCLRLECDIITVEWVRQFMRLLKDQGRWDLFRRLEVIQCHSLSKGSLYFIPNEKLHWE